MWQKVSHLKQSSTEPTTSSANSFGSLPVTLPILRKRQKTSMNFNDFTWLIMTNHRHVRCLYPLAADQRTMVSLSFSPTRSCSEKKWTDRFVKIALLKLQNCGKVKLHVTEYNFCKAIWLIGNKMLKFYQWHSPPLQECHSPHPVMSPDRGWKSPLVWRRQTGTDYVLRNDYLFDTWGESNHQQIS